jgi:hypothetical protein
LYKIRSSGVDLSQAGQTTSGKERLKIVDADGACLEALTAIFHYYLALPKMYGF